MISKSNCFLILMWLVFQFGHSQEKETHLKIHFRFAFNEESLQTNKKYLSDKKDTLQITNVKLYLSHFGIEYTDHSILEEQNSVHLIDLKKPESLHFAIPSDAKKTISKIHFNIGIDSLSSVSGAMEGDLDPMNGMYWSWQSGYINMKVEGKSPSCATRKNEFQFHIGGYESPNYAMRKLSLENKKETPEINIKINLATLFATLSLRETNSVMSPGKEAMKIADESTQIFSIE